jgi:competence protein ComEC
VLAVAVWAGAWAGTSGDTWLLAGAVAVGLGVGGLGWWRARWLVAAAGVALLAVAGLSGARVWFVGLGPVPEWAREGAVVTIQARVAGGQTSDRGRGGPVWTASATLIEVEGRGESWRSGATVKLSASGNLVRAWAEVPTGATIRVLVRLSPAKADEPVSAWARARASPQIVQPPGPLDVAVTAVRSGLRTAVAGLPAAPRALVPALVVGDTDLMTADLQTSFRTTGLTHLVAVSGTNLTLLLAAMLWATGRAGVTGWWRRGVAAVGVVAFVLLCRAEPSVLRAAAMGVVGLAALGWGGARQGLRYLSGAVVGLLLVDPWLCRSVGFALSVCASGGIILWANNWARLLSWAPGWLAEAVTVPIAAQVATQPVVTAISGQVSLVGIVANMVAAPLVGPGTVLGFVAAGLSVVSPALAAVVGWLAGGFAQALCWVAQAGAALPGAAMVWPAGPVALAVLTVCCVAVLVGLPLLWRRPWLVVLLAVAMVAVLFRPVSAPGWPPTAWQVVSCDVGQGDATVIAAGQGRAIVVDTGPDPVLADRCLDQLGITEVAWLVITHLHADHVGGVAGVASGRRVDNVLYSGVTQPPGGWQLLVSALPAVPRTVAVPGMVVAAGDVRLAVLAVKPYVDGGAVGEDSADQNDSSIVMRVTTGGLRIILGGDVEEAGQSNALATVPDLSAEVLLVPHHGSAHQSQDFLAGVHESVALVSVGKDNDYGHPAARTITAVVGAGAQVYRTDQNGAIAVAGEGDHLVVTTQRNT